MTISFLEDALIAEQTLSRGNVQIYDPLRKNEGASNMILDAQALQHLEVVEAANGGVKGSLLHYVDLCMTPFGKRQIKKWLLSPLNNKAKIT
jgi:DNA mismatch repair protein MSH6